MARAGLAIPFDGSREEPMNRKPVGTAFAALVATTALHAPALAQNEQFIPNLVYRTGAYAPNGIPFANGCNGNETAHTTIAFRKITAPARNERAAARLGVHAATFATRT